MNTYILKMPLPFVQHHHRAFLTKSHSLTTMRDMLGQGGGEMAVFECRGDMCLTHPDTVLDMYCITCAEAVCSKCALVAHQKDPHQCQMICDSADAYVSGPLQGKKLNSQPSSLFTWEIE